MTSIQCSKVTRDAVRRIAAENGMTLTNTLEALVACWRLAPAEQQREAVVTRQQHIAADQGLPTAEDAA